MSLLAKLLIGFNKPHKKHFGSGLAGEVESVGKEVKRFIPGDRVYGFSDISGAFADKPGGRLKMIETR